MRTTFLAVLTAAALLTLTGCVQVHSDINIDAKGGGTASMNVSVSSEVLAALTEMGKMGGTEMGPDMPDFNEITRANIEKKAAGRGVVITKFDKAEADGRQTLAFAVTFTDLKGLSWVMSDVAAGAGSDGLGIFAADGGNLVLRAAHYDFPAKPKKAAPAPAEPTQEQMQKQMELAGTLMSAIGELDIVMNFTVPGDVVKSNAPKVAGRTSTWAVNAENMMAQQADMAPEIVFAGKGLSIKPQAE